MCACRYRVAVCKMSAACAGWTGPRIPNRADRAEPPGRTGADLCSDATPARGCVLCSSQRHCRLHRFVLASGSRTHGRVCAWTTTTMTTCVRLIGAPGRDDDGAFCTGLEDDASVNTQRARQVHLRTTTEMNVDGGAGESTVHGNGARSDEACVHASRAKVPGRKLLCAVSCFTGGRLAIGERECRNNATGRIIRRYA